LISDGGVDMRSETKPETVLKEVENRGVTFYALDLPFYNLTDKRIRPYSTGGGRTIPETVGVTPDADIYSRDPDERAAELGKKFLRRISEISAGSFFDMEYRAFLGTEEEVQKAFQTIRRELSGHYTLAYYKETNDRGRQYRKISVKVRRPGVKVKAKKGYVPF